MDRWEKLVEQAKATARENELLSVENALWEEQGAVYLAIDRGAEVSGEPRNPRKRSWFGGGIFLFLGAVLFLAGLSNSAPITEAHSKKVIITLPFNPLFVLVGLLFIGIGYYLVCRVARLILDPQNQTWTLRRGVLPFVRTRTGAVDETTRWEMTTGTRSGRNNRLYDVWKLRLVGVPEASGALELPAFDLQQEDVERDAAAQAYSQVGERTGIPLAEGLIRADSTERTEKPEAGETEIASETPMAALRYQDSHITVAVEPDGRTVLTLSRRRNAASLVARFVVSLAPLAILLLVLHSMNESHRRFLQDVPAQSRAFFEESERRQAPVNAVFFMIFGGLALLPILLAADTVRGLEKRRITLGPDELAVADIRAGREIERQRIPLSDLDTVRASSALRDVTRMSASLPGGVGYEEKPSGASLSVLGMAIPLGRPSQGTTLLVSGPRRADTSLGGEYLSPADFAWLEAAVQAYVDPARRDEERDWIFASPLAESEPKAEESLPATAARKRLQYRLTLAGVAIVGLSLLNSYTLNLAIREQWTGENGTRFRHWTSGWTEGWYSLGPDGTLAMHERATSPVSKSTAGDPEEHAPEVGARRDYRWTVEPSHFALLDVRGGQRARIAGQARTMQFLLPPQPGAALLNKVADRFQSAGEWHAAEEFFQRAAQASHDHQASFYAYTSLATCYMAEERQSETVTALKMALAVPGDSEKEQASVKSLLARVEGGGGTLHERILGRNSMNHFPGEYVAGE